VQNALNSLKPVIAHVEAAGKAAGGWWTALSAAEKRLARQRASLVAVCVAACVMAGPFIGERFAVQKSEEAFRADAARLRASLAANRSDWREAGAPAAASVGGIRLASYAVATDPREGVTFNTAPDRNARALAGLAAFASKRFELDEDEPTELDCLAKAVYFEARSEDVRGQMAVAEVIMNRVKDSRFPKTVCAVVYQGQYRDTGCQFTFTCDGSLRHKPAGPAWDRARAVALNVSLGLNKPMTNKATHYHTDYVNPYWSAGMVETAEIGTHIFYRFPKTGPEWTRARLALAADQLSRVAYEPMDVVVRPDEAADPAPETPALVTISAEPDDAAVPAGDPRVL